MEFMLVIRDGEWKPCAYFIDGKRVSKEAYNILLASYTNLGAHDTPRHLVCRLSL